MIMLKRFSLVLLLIAACTLTGVLHAQDNTTLNVLATTTIIADVAQNVGGDLVTVTPLIPADTDIHAFQPIPSDVVLASQVDLVLVNGAGLESFLGDLLQGAVDDPSRIIVVSMGIPMLAGEHYHEEHEAEAKSTEEADHDHEASAAETVGMLGADGVCGDFATDATEETHEGEEHEDHGPCDPHVWTDPTNVKIWVDNIADAFATADPTNAEVYHTNAEAYKAQLDALDAEVTDILAVVPAERRVIVTNHEFLRYFAAHYDFEIVGAVIPSTSSLAEPAPQDLVALIEAIRAEGVRAIFVEVSDAGLLANVVADEVGSDIVIATLYSDSLSTADSNAGTYIDYVRANAQTVADALK
jgi:zinc/manganese transport system substrate-binding protein